MLARKILLVFSLTLFLGTGQAIIGLAGQGELQNRSGMVMTETLQVMGKGLDHIVIGEESLYVAPGITKITSRNGTAIDLRNLRTPCLAEVTYTRWMKGVHKLPLVLELKVKSTKSGASSSESQE